MELTRRFGWRTAALFALLAIAATGATATVAERADKVKSNVKLTEGGPDAIEGKITSKEAKCERRRKATLYMRAPTRAGGDREKVATDKSDQDGDLVFEPEGPFFTAGEYEAVLRQVIVGNLICRAAISARVAF